MPGAWEILAQRPNTLVAMLAVENVSTKWAMHFAEFRRHWPANSYATTLMGMPFDHARNTAAQSALTQGFEWLFFLDTDVCPPMDTIQRLQAHGRDIAGGVYYRRAQPLVPCMLRYGADGKSAEWVTKWEPQGSLIEVDLIGTGCLLIHRRVLERMAKPHFRWELDPDLQPNIADPRHSEDFSFCRRAKRDAGFQIFADTSVIAEHIGYGSSGAAGYQPATL